MRIKIISDGTAPGTRVVDARTGEPIDGITAISWKVDVNRLAEATLTFIEVPVDAEGETPIADLTDRP